MKVRDDTNVPIYRQICNSVKEDILSGKVRPGEYLPSIRALAQELDVSVITTVKAYKTLQDEGVIKAICGKGFLINEQNCEKLREKNICMIREELRQAVRRARMAGVTEAELNEILEETQISEQGVADRT